MYLTGRHLSRRTILRGLGAAVALPFLEAMVPARAAAARANVRLICVEMVHGSAGSAAIGIRKNLWAPAAVGPDFDLSPTSLRPLEPYRRHLTIVSNTDCANADAYEAKEVGGDHWRSSAVFLTQEHPRRTDGPDVEAGISLDQLFARRFGQDTPIPSMQLCIEPIDQAGGCGFGYSCVYADTISWASPTRPLPMIRDPRIVFDTLFGGLRLGDSAAGRHERIAEDRSILDRLVTTVARLQARLGPRDRARLSDYLDNIREVERRIQNVESYSRTGELRALPAAPDGVPDSFTEHVRLMFDLQVLALAADVTRVFAFKLGRDNSNRVYPESGFTGAFHPTSHHSGKEEKIVNFARLNTFHVGMIPYLLDKLQQTPDGGGTLLDHSVLLYGSAMGDSNQHNHRRVPFFIAGHGGGAIKGGVHLKAPNQTPLADVMLGVLHAVGMDDVDRFGDSEKVFDLTNWGNAIGSLPK
jgi:hypothetical protein